MIKERFDKITPEVHDILRNFQIENEKVYIGEQLDPALYQKVKKVIKTLGGEWNKKENAHIFSCDPTEHIEKCISEGKLLNIKNTNQEFYTPEIIAKRMIEYVDWSNVSLALEPSAGIGNIVHEINKEAPHVQVDAYEINEKSIAKFKGKANVVHANFMDIKDESKYDLVVMNPPFSGKQDIDHILHAYSLLKEDAHLISIASTSWIANTDKKSMAFKDFLMKRDADIEVIKGESFKESGTTVDVSLIKLRKRDGNEKEFQSRVGYFLDRVVLECTNDQKISGKLSSVKPNDYDSIPSIALNYSSKYIDENDSITDKILLDYVKENKKESDKLKELFVSYYKEDEIYEKSTVKIDEDKIDYVNTNNDRENKILSDIKITLNDIQKSTEKETFPETPLKDNIQLFIDQKNNTKEPQQLTLF